MTGELAVVCAALAGPAHRRAANLRLLRRMVTDGGMPNLSATTALLPEIHLRLSERLHRVHDLFLSIYLIMVSVTLYWFALSAINLACSSRINIAISFSF